MRRLFCAVNVSMDAERWKRVDELLQAAMQMPDRRQQEFLRQRLNKGSVRFLESPGLHACTSMSRPVDLGSWFLRTVDKPLASSIDGLFQRCRTRGKACTAAVGGRD